MDFFTNIKTMSKEEWVKKHINHNIIERYAADLGCIVAVLKCVDCNEIFLVDNLDINTQPQTQGGGV